MFDPLAIIKKGAYMHTVRFFPIGNADTCLIELENGKRALFDFADMRTGDQYDLRCDLEKELRACLGDDKHIEIVAFKLVVRNDSALFMHATFAIGGRKTKLILSADVTHEIIDDIARPVRETPVRHRAAYPGADSCSTSHSR